MAADLTMGEQLQRTLLGCVGVMEDDKLNAVVLIGRDMATINARATGAAGQKQKQQSAGEKSHRKRQRVSGL
ncbi:hypothetical protein D3C80_1766400 [compost metagenome]